MKLLLKPIFLSLVDEKKSTHFSTALPFILFPFSLIEKKKRKDINMVSQMYCQILVQFTVLIKLKYLAMFLEISPLAALYPPPPFHIYFLD